MSKLQKLIRGWEEFKPAWERFIHLWVYSVRCRGTMQQHKHESDEEKAKALAEMVLGDDDEWFTID